MVRKIDGCRSTGISRCKQSELVSVLIQNKINTASKIKMEINDDSLPNKNNLFVFYMIEAKKDSDNGTNSIQRSGFVAVRKMEHNENIGYFVL